MFTKLIPSGLKQLFRAGRQRGGRRGPSFRPWVESLETRLTPSAGALDVSFDVDGKLTTDFAGHIERANAVALQADGKIVVVGSTDEGGTGTNFEVVRYLADGTLDLSFSFDGRVVTNFGVGNDEARGVALDADGKIVVAGFATIGNPFNLDFALARYNPDGSPDDSFDFDGRVTTDFAGGVDLGLALVLQDDGKIVVAGSAMDGRTSFALARYNSNGSLDDTFDGDGRVGMVTTPIGANASQGRAVALQADGKIVVAGNTLNRGDPANSDSDFALARYNTNGSLDSDFDVDGMVITEFTGFDDVATSVALQANGRIVLAGLAGDGSNSHLDFALARYQPDGSLDFDFDVDGKVTTDLYGIGAATINGLVIQAAGSRIVAAGTVDIAGRSDFVLARYNPDGSLDTSFNGLGLVDRTNFGAGSDEATSVALQADGKIVVAGVFDDKDFALARFEGVAPEIAVLFGATEFASGDTLAFGTQLVGTPVSKTITIRNTGNLGLTVSSFALPAGYQLTPATSFPIKLAAGAQISLSVQLTARTAGVFSGNLSIGTNDSNENPFLIGVTGTVLAPTHEIQVLNGTVDLPDGTGVVNLGTATLQTRSDPHLFTVRNIGNTNLTLGPGIKVPGFILPSGFGSTTGSITLAPGASTTFALALNSSTVGTFVGQVSFATNDTDESPFSFTVKGAVSSSSTAPMIRGESLTRQVDEGGVATLRGHLVDPDPQDDLFLSIDWGDGTPTETHAVGHAPFAFEHRYLDDAPSGAAADEVLVKFTWFDSGGGSKSKALPVTVRNVAPQVSLGLPVLLRAGESLSRIGSFTDSGLDSWYATVDYGDGRGPQWLTLGADNSVALCNRYTRSGVYQVLVRVFDDDGGVGSATLNVNVRNDLPQLFMGDAEVVRAGEDMQHTARFTDAGADAWTATVDYGDGSGVQPLAIQSDGTLLFARRYQRPAKYRVTVTVLDDDGGLNTDTFLVIVLPPL